MSETRPEHKHDAASPPTAGGHSHPRHRKLHQDWRLWVIVVLMLAAMLIYVLTLDLR